MPLCFPICIISIVTKYTFWFIVSSPFCARFFSAFSLLVYKQWARAFLTIYTRASPKLIFITHDLSARITSINLVQAVWAVSWFNISRSFEIYKLYIIALTTCNNSFIVRLFRDWSHTSIANKIIGWVYRAMLAVGKSFETVFALEITGLVLTIFTVTAIVFSVR